MNEVPDENKQNQPLKPDWFDFDPDPVWSIDLKKRFREALPFKKFKTIEVRYDQDWFYVKDLTRGGIYQITYKEATVSYLQKLHDTLIWLQEANKKVRLN